MHTMDDDDFVKPSKRDLRNPGYKDKKTTQKAKYLKYLKAKTAYDGRPRATAEGTNIAAQHGPWRLIRAKSINSTWKLALIELKPGFNHKRKVRIAYSDQTITILKQWPPCHRGTSEKCAFNINLAKAKDILAKLAEMNIESAILLKAANYFDQV